MKRYNKIILITAGIVMIAGAVISAAAIGLGGAADNDISYKSETITEKITAINGIIDCDDITIIPRDTDTINVHYASGGTKDYKVSAENSTLTVEYAPDKNGRLKWYDYINFSGLDFMEHDNREHKIVIEVPRGFEADVSIENNYGDVSVSDIKGSLKLELDCGDAEIYGCDFTVLECEANYGDIDIKHTKAENIKVNNDCGDIELEEVTGNITASCSMGDIEFENITGNNLIFENSCGDIEGTVRGNEADYAPGGNKKLEADTDLGTVKIRFVK